jgi:membrane protein
MARLISALREAGIRFSNDGCAFLAQAVAFNALFALFPLAVLILTAASYLYPDSQRLVLAFADNLNPTLHDFVADNLRSYIYGRGISGVIALVFLIWSGKNLFMSIAFALNHALNIPQGRPFVHNFFLSVAMITMMAIAIIVATALPVVIAIAMNLANVPDRQHLTHASAYLVSIALVFTATMVLYRILPNRHVTWGFSLPGSIVVAILFPLVQFAFTQYTLHVNFPLIYGALATPLVLLFWFYVIGSMFFYGAEFCVAWQNQSNERRTALVA